MYSVRSGRRNSRRETYEKKKKKKKIGIENREEYRIECSMKSNRMKSMMGVHMACATINERE
jgi:hypothetical protein